MGSTRRRGWRGVREAPAAATGLAKRRLKEWGRRRERRRRGEWLGDTGRGGGGAGNSAAQLQEAHGKSLPEKLF